MSVLAGKSSKIFHITFIIFFKSQLVVSISDLKVPRDTCKLHEPTSTILGQSFCNDLCEVISIHSSLYYDHPWITAGAAQVTNSSVKTLNKQSNRFFAFGRFKN